MIYIVMAIAVFVVVFLTYCTNQAKKAKLVEYRERMTQLDAAREEAIRTGNIFTKKDQRTVENHLKNMQPNLNRRQRKGKAKRYGQQFTQRVHLGLE